MLFTIISTRGSPPPLAPMVFLDLRFLQQQVKEGGGGSRFVYIISLFTFESRIVLYSIILYLYINASFPHRNNN
jgi:hypothetical protein